jgi:hypothetical protein
MNELLTTSMPVKAESVDTPEKLQVQKRYKKLPVYNYKTGAQFQLSQRESILIETWLNSQNLTECRRVINEYMHPLRRITKGGAVPAGMAVATIKKWLQKARISAYIAEELIARGKVNWYTKDKWYADGVDMVQSGETNSIKVAAWRAYGAMRWPNDTNNPMQFNQQINFVQNDGRE